VSSESVVGSHAGVDDVFWSMWFEGAWCPRVEPTLLVRDYAWHFIKYAY
jgi:hypothetical protein